MSDLRDKLLLYAVTDRSWLHAVPTDCATLEHQVEEAVLGGVTLVQLREKDMDDHAFIDLAQRIKRMTDLHGVPLMINDSLAVALAADAAGLHIGQSDGDVRLARQRLSSGKILGVSVQTVAQACAAETSGADYLGVGAVFPTATKPEAAEVSRAKLTAICAAVRIPVVAIGGITRENVAMLTGTGIVGIAVVSALFAQGAGIRAAASDLKARAAQCCATQ